jgi:MSHA biogenesis protein MshN
MSLINDMLNDLNARHRHSNAINESALLGMGLTGTANPGNRQNRLYVVSATGLLVVAIMVWPMLAELLTPQRIHHNSPTTYESRPLVIPPEATRQANPEPEVLTAPASNTDTAKLPVAASPSAKSRQENITDTATQPVTSTRKHIEISAHPANTEQRLQDAYQGALRDARSGNNDAAGQQLEHLLSLDSHHHKARILLASLYIRQQQPGRAEDLLATGLADNPEHAPLAKLYAQLLVAQKRDREAIDFLQRALPAAAQDAEYHALLAGVYQRTGETATAIQYYQTALELSPDHGEWWMGLGISQEQAGRTDKAHATYKRALQYPLKTVLQQYVTTRMESLSR